MQAARVAWIRSFSRSLDQTPNSNASKLPTSTSRADLRKDPKQSQSVVSEQLLLRLRKVTGLWKVANGLTAIADKLCFAFQFTLALSPRVWLKARKGIACLSTMINSSNPVFQLTSGSPDQEYLNPYYMNVENRPAYGPSAFQSNLERDRWSASRYS